MRRAHSPPPSDPLFSRQWWLSNTGQFFGGPGPGRDLNALAAWDLAPGLTPATVVVLDTGVDINHPEFGGRAIYGPNEVDTTATSYDDAPGSHGTSVAGIIAAGQNGFGVVGIDPTAGIVAVKVLDSDGFGTDAQVAAGVDWARNHGFKIINLSLGGAPASTISELVYKNAYMSGMAVFASSGNGANEGNSYPAAYEPFVVAVGAYMSDGRLWYNMYMPWDSLGGLGPDCVRYEHNGSNHGPELHFLAPGGWFVETTRSVATGSYWEIRDTTEPDTNPTACNNGFGGTSAASPAAAGTAALVQSIVRPVGTVLTGEDLDQILKHTVDPTPDPDSLGLYAGAGNINAGNAAAMVAGARTVEHGAAAAPESTLDRGVSLLFLDAWGSVAPGQYAAQRYIMRKRVAFSSPFADVPIAWARKISSWGAGADTVINYERQQFDWCWSGGILQWRYPPPWTPSADVEAVTRDSVTLRTYVYRVASTHWWPTRPESAFVAYTAIGPISTAGVDRQGSEDYLHCAVSPNPALGKVRIRFTLPVAGKVKLRIYDVAGRCVRELESGGLLPGEKNYTWDISQGRDRAVPRGVYFARLETPSGSRATRFVILR